MIHELGLSPSMQMLPVQTSLQEELQEMCLKDELLTSGAAQILFGYVHTFNSIEKLQPTTADDCDYEVAAIPFSNPQTHRKVSHRFVSIQYPEYFDEDENIPQTLTRIIDLDREDKGFKPASLLSKRQLHVINKHLWPKEIKKEIYKRKTPAHHGID